MGSKLRRLRVQAGVTGYSYQARQRAETRRARSTKKAPAACTSCGSAVPDPRRMLCADCSAKLAAASTMVRPSWAADEARTNQERRVRLMHLVGSHEGAAELADAIQAAALAKTHASVHPNLDIIDGVWEQALAELRRGVSPSELSVLRPQGGLQPAPREPRPPAPGMSLARRMPLLQQVLAVSMLLVLAADPKEER